MNSAIKTNQSQYGSMIGQMAVWLIIVAAASAVTIFLHEVAHFAMANAVGAADITFHWADVLHDPDSVSNVSNAMIALFGPLASFLMIFVAWRQMGKEPSSFFLGLGAGAASRGLTVLPFTLRTLLGRDTSGFSFDEFAGATALGIPPLVLVLVTLTISFISAVYFGRAASREKGAVWTVLLWVGVFAGIFAWGIFGPMLFPGGRGFN